VPAGSNYFAVFVTTYEILSLEWPMDGINDRRLTSYFCRRCRQAINQVMRCLLFVFLLYASGSAQALTSVTSSIANLPAQTAATLQPMPTWVVGSEQDYPPFATGMTDATAGGFTVELWQAVAAEAGLNYTLRVRPFHQLLQEFKDGKIDVLINLAQSDERRQFAAFSVPHVVVHGAIFARKGQTDIDSEDDLTGKSIIVLNADLAHDYAVAKGWAKQLVLVNTAAEGMRLLATGQHDVMLLSRLVGMQTLNTLGLKNIEPIFRSCPLIKWRKRRLHAG